MAFKVLLPLLAVCASVSAKTFIGSPFYNNFAGIHAGNLIGRPYGYAGYAAAPYAGLAPAGIANAAPAPIAHASPAPAPLVKAAPVPVVSAAPAPAHIPSVTSSQYHSQDEFGSVEYGYSNINSAKQESRDKYGNVAGAYSYVDSTGLPKTVSYVADAYGFRLTGANNLPLAPADTPEVAYAKQAHFNALLHAGH